MNRVSIVFHIFYSISHISGTHSRSIGQMDTNRWWNLGQGYCFWTKQKSRKSICPSPSSHNKWIWWWIWRNEVSFYKTEMIYLKYYSASCKICKKNYNKFSSKCAHVHRHIYIEIDDHNDDHNKSVPCPIVASSPRWNIKINDALVLKS